MRNCLMLSIEYSVHSTKVNQVKHAVKVKPSAGSRDKWFYADLKHEYL